MSEAPSTETAPQEVEQSTALARAVVARLIAAGVSDVVIAPGSRNAPLSFAAFDAAEAGIIRLHTRIDERSAGFLALGLAKGHRPAAVVCTSGTGAANLHPAVLEALHAGVPLVAVTADRPLRLRGTSANQTTAQVGLFHGVQTHDLSTADQVRDRLAGLTLRRAPFAAPLHLNVCLDDPLVPPSRWQDLPGRGGSAPGEGVDRTPWWRRPVEYADLGTGPRTVVVAGDDAGPPARILARDAHWPLLAEPSSGARTGDQAIGTYRLLLDTDLGQQIERVVVYGHPTLSRPVSRLLAREDVEVLAVPSPGADLHRPFRVDRSAAAWRVDRADGSGWLESWLAADRERAAGIRRLLGSEPDLTPYDVAGAVASALPPGGLLVVGASNPIRDLDLTMAPYPPGEHRKVVANRGLAGIDGTLSTAIGSALTRPDERCLALVGDVTFVHDTNGLLIGPGQPLPDLTIVVVNDDGGSIFATLEQGSAEHSDRFEALFGTPHGTDLASLCAAHRIPHWRIDGRGDRRASRAELDQALASPAGGIEVVEVVCRRDNRRELDERIRAL